MASKAPQRRKLNTESDTLCISTIRALAADMVQKPKSGHPGAPMGCAPMAHVLFGEEMKFDPADESWPNRDRFVLSNGHACTLQYAMLHLCGYPLTLEDLKQFRTLNSKTPGHPECHMTCGIEVSTGPLGQGISNGVGFAIARAHMAARFNRPGFPVCDHNVFVICGDGCLQEGVSAEACSLAGHLGLGSLILLYDDNQIQIDGSTDLAFTEDVVKRFEGYGWHTLCVKDGDTDLSAIRAAIAEGRAVTDRPTMIKVTTTIGFGSAKQGTHKVHGAPLGPEDLANLKKGSGLDPTKHFQVAPSVRSHYQSAAGFGRSAHSSWDAMLVNYAEAHPALAAEYVRRMAGKLPDAWASALPTFNPGDKDACRGFSGKVLAALAPIMPEMLCGSADLSPSNKTNCAGWGGDFQAKTPAGRYIRFGVREHAMSAICNGLSAYGGIVPACATFLAFTGYALGAMRISALSRHQVIYVMTHDSIALGEDGPTHQPVEHFAALRAMPNMLFIRPCDGIETAGAYAVALTRSHTPTTLALSRQKVVCLPGSSADGVAKGAYVIDDDGVGATRPDLVLVGTGAEVGLCVAAKQLLGALKPPVRVRVVSMPCWKLLEEQSIEYQRAVFGGGAPVMAVEAGATMGWSRYSHAQIGVDKFGKSAPGGDIMADYGFTADKIAHKAKQLISFYKGGEAPDLTRRPQFS